MTEFEARVSFDDMPESAVDARLSIADEHLAIEVAGRPVGRWPISELSPRLSGETVVVSAEGEHLVIDVTDPDALRVSLRLSDLDTERMQPPGDAETEAEPGTPTAGDAVANAHRDSLRSDNIAMAAAQTQLHWVQELVPRRLPIPLRENESGLGVVQGVQLKERRPQPGSEGLQPWVVVDSGNVYVTTMRLIFSGVTDIEFEFEEINKKGASKTGLLLGVSSRVQSHILEGPGERLAVVLTAAEKIAKGVDPTLPFRQALVRLTSEIQRDEERLESSSDEAVTTRSQLD